jgi:hypothetical protein
MYFYNIRKKVFKAPSVNEYWMFCTKVYFLLSGGVYMLKKLKSSFYIISISYSYIVKSIDLNKFQGLSN